MKLTRKELYKRVWSTSMVKLAAKFGMSDVALKKRCKRHAIPTPSIGYWRKIETGRKPFKTPLPKCPKGVEEELHFHVPSEEIQKQVERFGSAEIPRFVTLPSKGDPLHARVGKLKERLKEVEAGDKGLKEIEEKGLPHCRVSDKTAWKCCQCVQALIELLERNGMRVGELDGDKGKMVFVVGKDYLAVDIVEIVECREVRRKPSNEPYPPYRPPEYSYHPTGFLNFEIRGYSLWDIRGQKNWNESEKQSVEWIIPRIAKRMITIFPRIIEEGIKRRRREAERREAQRRREHAEWIEAHKHGIVENLERAAFWWERCKRLEGFAREVEAHWKAEAEASELSDSQKAWLSWAGQWADPLNPFRRGYPDPSADGPVDHEMIEIGGPYPKRSKLAAIPPIETESKESSPRYDRSHREERPYPFWLRHRR